MPRRPASYTQADVTRLIKGALAAGIRMEQIAGVQHTKDGPRLLFGEQESSKPEVNEWDEVLQYGYS